MHTSAADADGCGFDAHVRAALGVGHRRADRLGHGFLIGDAALGPAGGGGKAMSQIPEVLAFERTDNASRAGTACVKANRELGLR